MTASGRHIEGRTTWSWRECARGFAVIGDTHHLPGYSLLLTDDRAIDHLTDLDWEALRR